MIVVNIPSFDRCLTMGAFEALRVARKKMQSAPDISFETAIKIVQQIDADSVGLDFIAAIELHSHVSITIALEPSSKFYQICLAALLRTAELKWIRSVTLGRKKILSQVSRDGLQCFRAAQLADDYPNEYAVAWWDLLASDIRTVQDGGKLARGRGAERLTIEFERERLKKAGIADLPRWVSIDDNTAGFDVLSYDSGEFGPVNRMIEVKSSVASPLKYHVSRNEWESAQKYGDAFYFYVWNMNTSPPQLYVKTVLDVRSHVPTDSGDGKWSSVLIPLGGMR